MAYYNDPQDEEQNANQPAQTGPSSSVITGTPGNAPSSPTGTSSASPDKSGNFVGLQTYLNANKPQAAKLGDQASGIVQNSVNDARNSVSGLNDTFNQTVDQNTVKENQDALNTVGTGAEKLTADQRAELKKDYGAQYQGPNNLNELSDYQGTLNKQNLAGQNLQSTGSEAGRMGLVNQINSAPRTRGDSLFDSMLLQKGPGRDQLLNVASQNKDVPGLLDKAQTAAQGTAQTGKDTTKKTQADTLSAVQNALSAWQSGFQPRLQAAQNTDQQKAATDELANGNRQLDESTRSLLGLSPGQTVYNTDLSKYLNPFSPTDVTAANVATPEDYARYGALADLSGEAAPYLNQADVSKAGTAPQFSADQAKLQNDLGTAKGTYDKAYSSTRDFLAPYNNVLRVRGGAMLNATPQEVEKYWIPYYQNSSQPNKTDMIKGLTTALNDFKNSYGVNNRISLPQPTGTPTRPITTLPVRRV